MARPKADTKAFNVRLPKNTWRFLKELAFREEVTMNDIIVKCVQKLEMKAQKRVDDKAA